MSDGLLGCSRRRLCPSARVLRTRVPALDCTEPGYISVASTPGCPTWCPIWVSRDPGHLRARYLRPRETFEQSGCPWRGSGSETLGRCSERLKPFTTNRSNPHVPKLSVANRLTKVVNSAGPSTWPTEYRRTFACPPQWLPVLLATASSSPSLLPPSPPPPSPNTWLTNDYCESRAFPAEVIIVHELDTDYTFAMDHPSSKALPSVCGVSWPPQWLPVFLATAPSSPSPPLTPPPPPYTPLRVQPP